MFRRSYRGAAPEIVTRRALRGAGPTKTPAEDPAQKEYRDHLVEAQQKAQEDYDKTLILLAGGAFGLSLAFVEKMFPGRPYLDPELLFWSWNSWGAALAFTLASFLTSHHALRRCIDQHDSGRLPGETPGGWLTRITISLNVLAGVSFLLGLVLMSAFVLSNLGKGNHGRQQKTSHAIQETWLQYSASRRGIFTPSAAAGKGQRLFAATSSSP